MSLTYRNRIAQLLAQDQNLGMTDAEKKDIYGWCGISDNVVKELMKRQGITGDIDKYIEKLSDDDIKDIHAQVMKIYRLRRKKGAAKYLRQEGRTEQADKLDEEIQQEEAQQVTT